MKLHHDTNHDQSAKLESFLVLGLEPVRARLFWGGRATGRAATGRSLNLHSCGSESNFHYSAFEDFHFAFIFVRDQSIATGLLTMWTRKRDVSKRAVWQIKWQYAKGFSNMRVPQKLSKSNFVLETAWNTLQTNPIQMMPFLSFSLSELEVVIVCGITIMMSPWGSNWEAWIFRKLSHASSLPSNRTKR